MARKSFLRRKRWWFSILGLAFSAVGMFMTMVLTAIIAVVPGAALLATMANVFNVAAVPAAYRDFVAATGNMCDEVTPQLISAQIEQESGWKPDAYNRRSGAMGMSQFIPSTWEQFGEGDPRVPRNAIQAQERYDCYLVGLVNRMKAGTYPGQCVMTMHGRTYTKPAPRVGEMVGDTVDLMLASYNAGPGTVCYYRGIPPWSETQGYVPGIRARMAKYQTTNTSVTDAVYRPGDAETLGGRALAWAMKVVSGDPIGEVWPGGRVPYSWGGGNTNGPTHADYGLGFDCSGLMMYIFYQASQGSNRLVLPHYSGDQEHIGGLVTRGVGRVDEHVMRPGDVIFYTRPGETDSHHVAIYAGNGTVVNAYGRDTYVRVDPFSSFSASDTWTVRRFSDPPEPIDA